MLTPGPSTCPAWARVPSRPRSLAVVVDKDGSVRLKTAAASGRDHPGAGQPGRPMAKGPGRDTAGHHQRRQGRVLRNRHEGHGRTAKAGVQRVGLSVKQGG
jgi:hypothetical protein